MMRYGLTLSEARNLQKWALETCGAKKFLDTLPKLPKTKKIRLGLYMSYEIDVSDLEDDGLDYCTPKIASVLIVDSKQEMTEVGSIMAYNWETYWLYFEEDCEVDTAENWFDLIQKEYKKIQARDGLLYDSPDTLSVKEAHERVSRTEMSYFSEVLEHIRESKSLVDSRCFTKGLERVGKKRKRVECTPKKRKAYKL